LRRVFLPQAGWTFIAMLIGVAILWPILQLELRAFADGAAAFSRMVNLPSFGKTLRTTIILTVFFSVLAVIMAVLLDCCALMLLARVRRVGQLLPLQPLLVPAVATVTGWTFLFTPPPDYQANCY
jgi:iron(III) transport system permease protein